MNTELIRDIAKQCDFDWHKHWADDGENNLEKFAELIIRDCIDICDAVQTQYGQYTFTATSVKDRVKEHFGVE